MKNKPNKLTSDEAFEKVISLLASIRGERAGCGSMITHVWRKNHG